MARTSFTALPQSGSVEFARYLGFSIAPGARMDLSVVYRLAAECPESVTVDRLVAIYHQLSAAVELGVPGAVVELGCYRGVTSRFIRQVLDTTDPSRGLHVFDTFAGLPKPGELDGTLEEADFSASTNELLAGFERAGLRPPVVHRGQFKDTLPTECPASICFAYVDADCEASIQEALSGIYGHLSVGAVLMIDDYCDLQRSPRCWNGLPGVRTAVDRFFAERPERVVPLVGTGDLSLALVRKR